MGVGNFLDQPMRAQHPEFPAHGCTAMFALGSVGRFTTVEHALQISIAVMAHLQVRAMPIQDGRKVHARAHQRAVTLCVKHTIHAGGYFGFLVMSLECALIHTDQLSAYYQSAAQRTNTGQ